MKKRLIVRILSSFLSIVGLHNDIQTIAMNNNKLISKDAKRSNNFKQVEEYMKKNGKGITEKILIGASIVGLKKVGEKGVQNAIFPNSNKNWFYKETSNKEVLRLEKDLLEESGYSRVVIDSKDKKMSLSGFVYNPNSTSSSEIKNVVLVTGGNADIACRSLPVVVNNEYDEKKDTNTVYLSFDFPSYAQSKGPKLSQQCLENYADVVYNYIIKTYPHADLSLRGFSLGGYPTLYLGKYKKVKEIYMWSPICLVSAVIGLTGKKALGNIIRFWGFGLDMDNFNFMDNISKLNNECKIYLYSGSLEGGDFLSLETSVLKTKNYKPKRNESVSKEVWEKLVEKNESLKDRLIVSFSPYDSHNSRAFDKNVWEIGSNLDIYSNNRKKSTN